MTFLRIQSDRNIEIIAALLVASISIGTLGAFREYNFVPDRHDDGFAVQIKYIGDMVIRGQWTDLLFSPLQLIHTIRFFIAWPFLTLEKHFGGFGSLSLLLLCLWPLVLAFPSKRGDPWDITFTALRFLILLLPLAVSGRTVLVIAGMGYLVSGALKRPFSFFHIMLGALFAVLSSASILYSIAILLIVGSSRGRSKAFQVAKWATVALVIAAFVPSLLAKAQGFAAGTPGYSYEGTDLDRRVSDRVEDGFGIGALPAIKRILARSTIAESYRNGNFARMFVYFGLFGAAIAYVTWALLRRQQHPINAVLVVLSTGILIEGLALWPILLPILWAYTGAFIHSRVGLTAPDTTVATRQA